MRILSVDYQNWLILLKQCPSSNHCKVINGDAIIIKIVLKYRDNFFSVLKLYNSKITQSYSYKILLSKLAPGKVSGKLINS